MRIALFILVAALAGCADVPVDGDQDGDPGLSVTDTTGGIRGVVVDDSITPVDGATVLLVATQQTAVTDDTGSFRFEDLEPGPYSLDVSRIGYASAQVSTQVEAGVANPPVVKVQLTRIPGADPYYEIHQLNGFYSCAFATIFITDSCEFAVRTAYDEMEERGVPNPGVPRTIQTNDNTQYIPWLDDIQTVVHETYWDPDATTLFRSSLQATPIDNGCDCSHKYMQKHGGGGYVMDRMDRANLGTTMGAGDQTWPSPDDLENDEVVTRGFIPFQENFQDVQQAVNVEFEIFTSLFHWYEAPAEWSLETRYDFPDP